MGFRESDSDRFLFPIPFLFPTPFFSGNSFAFGATPCYLVGMPISVYNPADFTAFLTLPDPLESGEGALDPLGLATLADHLAEWILPGMAVRMSRPRFLTAIAVSAAVCEGLEEEVAADDVTPAWLVLEWMLVEAFARARKSAVSGSETSTEGDGDNRGLFQGTPGILKAATARNSGIPLSAGSYLKAPTVFGFHGVYKRLACHVGIADDDFQAQENGFQLLKIWEKEQGLPGHFTACAQSSGGRWRDKLRSAVQDGLSQGCIDRTDGWSGWSFFANHLAPGAIAQGEADFLRRLLLDPRGEPRGELFQLIAQPEIFQRAGDRSEAALVGHLMPLVSTDLAARLQAIAAYENVATLLDDCWDWLRYLSTQASVGARTLKRAEFANVPEVREAANRLPEQLRTAQQALRIAPRFVPEQFDRLANFFEHVQEPQSLYDALLERHARVQKAKPPEGKREWFERGADGSVFVRIPYRLTERPQPREAWRRPYRLRAVLSFCGDLNRAQS
jgi:hypothetical protein